MIRRDVARDMSVEELILSLDDLPQLDRVHYGAVMSILAHFERSLREVYDVCYCRTGPDVWSCREGDADCMSTLHECWKACDSLHDSLEHLGLLSSRLGHHSFGDLIEYFSRAGYAGVSDDDDETS